MSFARSFSKKKNFPRVKIHKLFLSHNKNETFSFLDDPNNDDESPVTRKVVSLKTIPFDDAIFQTFQQLSCVLLLHDGDL